jgi:L-aminopeptidase/D-esterase-like protein
VLKAVGVEAFRQPGDRWMANPIEGVSVGAHTRLRWRSGRSICFCHSELPTTFERVCSVKSEEDHRDEVNEGKP